MALSGAGRLQERRNQVCHIPVDFQQLLSVCDVAGTHKYLLDKSMNESKNTKFQMLLCFRCPLLFNKLTQNLVA
jgi:hypothetical protein